MANKEWLRAGADRLTFGERLGDLISGRGITQSQLAEQTGIKQSAVSEYINGKKNGCEERAPDCATVIALARFFSVSTDYLLGQSPFRTQDSPTRALCERTGLSERSVLSLEAYSPQSTAFISELIEEAEITQLGLLYANLKRSRKNLRTAQQKYDAIDKSSAALADLSVIKGYQDAKEKADFDRWKLERKMMSILEKMAEKRDAAGFPGIDL